MRISDWSSDVCSSDLKKRCPVDMLTQVVQIPVHIDMQPRLFGRRRLQCRVDYEGVCPRLLDGSQLTLSLVCTRFADDIIFLRHLRDERIALRITDQGGCDAQIGRAHV